MYVNFLNLDYYYEQILRDDDAYKAVNQKENHKNRTKIDEKM